MIKNKLWTLLAVVGLFTACKFTEEIHFKEDGSGRVDIYMDGSEILATMAGMDTTGTMQYMDSTLVFKELLELEKDSIAQLPEEEQAKLKKLAPFSLRMVMDPEEETLRFNLFSTFKNVTEINDAYSAFQEAGSMGNVSGAEAMPESMELPPLTAEVSYAFENNTFTRSTSGLGENEMEQSVDSLGITQMFLSGATYTFKYHFPRRIKSVNVEGALFSMDGKSMVYEVNFKELLENPEPNHIEVVLED
ncbi:MAG: hypothetical protein AAGF77_13340 [Bacteroidota bacterium]